MKADMGGDKIHILDLSIRCGLVIMPEEQAPQYPFIKGCVRPGDILTVTVNRKIACLYQQLIPDTLSCSLSLYWLSFRDLVQTECLFVMFILLQITEGGNISLYCKWQSIL
jgi:hypothetical protein